MTSESIGSASHFYIKAGYQPRSNVMSYESDIDDVVYWTAERLKNAECFQYDVYHACRQELAARSAPSLLELGCGPAIKTAKLLQPYTDRMVLMDQPSMQPMVQRNVKQGSFVAVNLDGPIDDLETSFDVIICADVIEHLVDPDHCLRLIHRVLHPEGVAFISTPERDLVRGTHCQSSPNTAHIREWNSAELAAYLKSHQFNIRRHELVPQKRLSPLERCLRATFGSLIKSPRWHGCQMLVVNR